VCHMRRRIHGLGDATSVVRGTTEVKLGVGKAEYSCTPVFTTPGFCCFVGTTLLIVVLSHFSRYYVLLILVPPE
jgi:hypothetical protein